MYRKSLRNKMSDTESVQFVNRVSSLPIITAAVGQLGAIYHQTKQTNRLVKYTLETAENGIVVATNTAKPLINKIDAPLGKLDSFACGQLDKLEEKYPVIMKPTDQVYEGTLKPTVDRVLSVTQYSKDKYNNVKDTTVNTVTGVKDYTVAKIDGVKNYSYETIDGVKNYSYQTVDGVKNYSYQTVDGVKNYSYQKYDGVKNYSFEKMASAVQSPYGQLVAGHMNVFLDKTDQYIDYYLPEQNGNEADDSEENDEVVPPGEEVPASQEVVPPVGTLGRVTGVSDKVRRRMYARAVRQLTNLQARTKETLERLNFTVDLMEYAKTNMAGAKQRVVAAGSYVGHVWEEVNKSEESVSQEATDQEHKPTDLTLERRAIATARHLTLNMKKSLTSVTAATAVLPASIMDTLNHAKNYSHQLYLTFSNADNVRDLSQGALTQTRTTIGNLQKAMNSVTDYVTNSAATWLMLDKRSENAEEIEMSNVIGDPELESSEQSLEAIEE